MKILSDTALLLLNVVSNNYFLVISLFCLNTEVEIKFYFI